jgi:3-deoxy-D-manno-octulosonic-acid transferase
MRKTLALRLYRFWAGQDSRPLPDWGPRPAGQLVWLHCPQPACAKPLLELARRIREEDGHAVLVTGTVPMTAPPGVTVTSEPPETAEGVRAFLDHWTPNVALFADGELRPLLIAEAARRRVRMALVDARAPYLPGGKSLWWPGLARALLSRIDRILTVDEPAARLFRRKAGAEARIRAEGRMEEGSSALPCNEAERAALVRQFQTRPVWLAAALPEVEESAVIAAHRAALRQSHRLLLILVPENPARAEPLARHLAETEGWTVARRGADEEPEEDTEVFIAENQAEMGLWYRLAPITFLGGSLYGNGPLRDPFEAAALGSSILRGPKLGDWAGPLTRLAEGRAARLTGSASELAEGLADLLSPDRAARLAQAAWAVASTGAEVTDRVILTVREMLEGEA